MIGTRFFGRCGNVMFQASHCIALSFEHRTNFSFPNSTTNPKWNPLYLQHLVDPNWIQGKEDVLINELHHEWQPIEWKDEWHDKQVVLNGYWQSEKYFKKYRNEILYLFDFPYEMKEGIVSVHIRRGDYLNLRDKHPDITKEWYEMAMAKFPGYKFKFFSDDIPYCRQTFGHRSDCEFSANVDEISDLVEMASCEHNICSPSTFAWWGMWANKNENKKVIFPKLWFVENYHLNTKDIVPEWCEKI